MREDEAIRSRALYHLERFGEALDAVQREATSVPHALTFTAAILARLGRAEGARAVVRQLEAGRPAVTPDDLVRPLPYRRPQHREDLAAALKLAGLPA